MLIDRRMLPKGVKGLWNADFHYVTTDKEGV